MAWQSTLADARAVPVDLAALRAVVGEVVGGEVTSVTPLAGGLGSLLDLVTVTGGERDRVVLRRLLPEFGDDAAVARRERDAHDVVTAGGVPAPAALWSDVDGERLGRPALLIEFVTGRPIVADLASPTAVAAFVEAVTAVHAVPATAAPATLPRLTDLDTWEAHLPPSPATASLVDGHAVHTATRALSRAVTAGDCVVHTDLHGGNVLWDGQQATGIVDWPGAAVGSRWADEAYAVMDTSLAHGLAAGDRLRAALRERADDRAPTDEQWAVWTGAALIRCLPTPGEWVEAFVASGCDVTRSQLEQRFVDQVDRFLSSLP